MSWKHSLGRQGVDGVGYDVYNLYIIGYFFHFFSCFLIYFAIYHYPCQCQYQQQYQYSSSGVERCHIIVLVVCSSFLLYSLVYSYARNQHILVLILCSGLGILICWSKKIVQHCVHYKQSNWSQTTFQPSFTDICPLRGKGKGREEDLQKAPHLISSPHHLPSPILPASSTSNSERANRAHQIQV